MYYRLSILKVWYFGYGISVPKELHLLGGILEYFHKYFKSITKYASQKYDILVTKYVL